MSTAAPTIIDLKIAFLRSQIHLLSRPLQPSAEWTASNDAHNQEETSTVLRQRAIDEAIYKLNRLLKEHNKLSYGPQATRHVAEQIDRLYWSAGERGVIVPGEEWENRGADYTKDHIIAQLPTSWSEEAESRAPEQAARYKELQQRLVELSEKRRVARERVERYKGLREALSPFAGTEAGLQSNLITRDGEVEKELERMKMLMVRVERGLSGLEKKDDEEGEEEDDGMEIDGEFGDVDARLLQLMGDNRSAG
ncbi:kinetochore Sim4 complex subunit Fta4 [Xylogone sp. PMI_703]|nr:kinetochore Sim4 complex subunit Fta4 [Xylogone sp. PMI_703]